jgi:hypothetical protein
VITLTIIVLLVFVPASRRIFGGIIASILSLLGLAFFITRDAGRFRRKS